MGVVVAIVLATLGGVILLVRRRLESAMACFVIGGLFLLLFTSFKWVAAITIAVSALALLALRYWRAEPIIPRFSRKVWLSGGVLLTLGGLVAGIIGLGTTPDQQAQADGGGTPNNSEAVEALTVRTATYKCPTDDNGLVSYHIGALEEGRKWSDAVSTPMSTSNSEDMLAEVQEAVCHDPLYGSMVANYFAGLEVESVEVVSLNPWLEPFEGDGATVINVQAASYIPLLDKSSPTDEEVEAAIQENKDWQGVANRLNTLLARFSLDHVKEERSTLNYHVLGGGLVVDTLPAIGLNNRQESLPALQLILTSKGVGCVLKIGFNAGDKRLEEFPCKPPTSRPTTTAKPPAPKPTMTPPPKPPAPKPTTAPTPKPKPTTPKPTIPTLQPKNPAEDPAPRGNAPVGGGRNEDPGPGVPNPKPTVPSTPRTNPPPPAPKPTNTSRPTPPVETSAPVPSDPATGCVPAPGKTDC